MRRVIKDYLQLVEYASAYRQRYFPSRAKCRQKLIEKCPDREGDVTRYFVDVYVESEERELAMAMITSWLRQGINRKKIKARLTLRQFPRDVIEDGMQEFCPPGESVLLQDKSERQVEKLKRRGLSPRHIIGKLSECREDHELLSTILAEKYHEADLKVNLQREFEKCRNKGLEDKKIMQRLQRKGFGYQDIKRAMAGN